MGLQRYRAPKITPLGRATQLWKAFALILQMVRDGIVFTVHWRTREVLSVAGGNDPSPDAPHRHPHKPKLRQPHLGPPSAYLLGGFFMALVQHSAPAMKRESDEEDWD
jgi:hypothetical protein